MIEELGLVTMVTGDRARVQCTVASACDACGNAGRCDSWLPSSLFRHRRRELDAWDPVGTCPGDRVVIGIQESILGRASLLTFTLPLAGLFSGALTGQWLTAGSYDGELASIVGGLTGLIAGLATVRVLSEQLFGDAQCDIKILRVVGTGLAVDRLSRAISTDRFSEKK